jgi:predicted homoserine dehydrogenase-like protein
MGLAESCRLTRNINKDEAISWDDVITPTNDLPHQLRAKQDAKFAPARMPATSH